MRSVCPQAGKKGMTSARLSELYQKVLREALDMVSRVQCRGACPSHTVIFCRPCPYPPSGGKCLVGRAERAQCVSPAPARRQGGLSVTSVLGRGEIGRLATAGAAVVPITTSLSLGTSSRFRDEPAHLPDDCISARHRQLGRRDRAGWESIGCLCSSEHRRRPRIYGSSRWKKTAKMERDIAKYVGASHPIYVT